MRMRQWIAGAAVFALSAFLCLPANVQAQEQTASGYSSSTTITVQVPETHTADLTVTGKGAVTVNGQTYTETAQIQIPRLEEVSWQFVPAEGYTLEAVLYNGTNVTGTLEGDTYTAEPVYEDGTEVQVTFARKSSGSSGEDESAGGSGSKPSGSTSGGASGTDSPKTGDDTATGLWTGAMTVSAILALSCLMVYRRKRV